MPNWLMTLGYVTLGAMLVLLIIILAVATIGLISMMKEWW